MTMFRRTLLAAAALVALTGAAQAAPTATIVLPSQVNTFDPANTGSVVPDLSLISELYAALIIRGPDMKLHPQLATDWRAVDDTTWHFTLRDGASFANGEKLDAAAVKWNIERVRDPKANMRVKAWFDLVTDVRVLSPTELEIKTRSPYPALADQLSMFFLLPPAWTASHHPAQEVMPSGPYELAENVPGDHYTLKARPGWFGAKPAFDTVIYRIIPDAGARIAALLAGEVDLITQVPPSEIARIKASGRADAGAVDSSRAAFVKFNNFIAPEAGNAKFRQALNYAVDKVGIRDAILAGYGSISNCQVLSKDYFGYNPDLRPYPYDPAKARQLLRESGVNLATTTLEFESPIGVYLQSSEIIQAIAAQLQDVGVRTRITEMDFGAFMNKYVKAPTMGNLAYLTQAWPTLDADGLLTLFQDGSPYAYWPDKEFANLLAEARGTADPAKRLDIYKQATARMCEQAPVIFLFNQPATYGLSKKVNWQPRGDDWLRGSDLTAR